VRARDLVDSQFVTLDLGESLEVEGVVLPRFSTWKLNKFGIPEDLIALTQVFPPEKRALSEAISKADKDEIAKIVKKEIKAFGKADKKDDMTLIKNALVSLFKAFYTKRSFWTGDISGDRSS
jgi:histidyl-tRNA synthetase